MCHTNICLVAGCILIKPSLPKAVCLRLIAETGNEEKNQNPNQIKHTHKTCSSSLGSFPFYYHSPGLHDRTEDVTSLPKIN